jgi:hypothetical protein
MPMKRATLRERDEPSAEHGRAPHVIVRLDNHFMM